MNENAKSALATWREANPDYKRENLDPVQRAKANPRSKVLAIKAMCWECSGGQKTEVTNCTCNKCPLWDHRPWVKNNKEESDQEN